MAKANKVLSKIAVAVIFIFLITSFLVFSLQDTAFAADEWVLEFAPYTVPEDYEGSTTYGSEPFGYIGIYQSWSSSSFQPIAAHYLRSETQGENEVPTSFTLTFTNVSTSETGVASFTQVDGGESGASITGVTWTKAIPSAGDYKITSNRGGGTFGYIRCVSVAVLIQPQNYPCQEVYGIRDSQGDLFDYKAAFTNISGGISDIALVKYFRLNDNFYYDENTSYTYNDILEQNYTGRIPGWNNYSNLHLKAYWEHMIDGMYPTIQDVGKYGFDLAFTDANGEKIEWIISRTTGSLGSGSMAELSIIPKELGLTVYNPNTGTGALVMQESKFYDQTQDFPAGDPIFSGSYLRKDGSDDVFSAEVFHYLIACGLEPEDVQSLFQWKPLTGDLFDGGSLTVAGNVMTLRNTSNVILMTATNTGGVITTVATDEYIIKGGTTRIIANVPAAEIDIDINVSGFDIPVDFVGKSFYMQYPTDEDAPVHLHTDRILSPIGTVSSIAIDDFGAVSPNVGGNKILSAYFKFNTQSYPVLKNYFPNIQGNQSLYAEGYADRNQDMPTDEKQWLKDKNNETDYGIVLLSNLGPKGVVDAAQAAGITASGETDAEKYLSLTELNKQVIYAYLSAEGKFSGVVSDDYAALTYYQTGRAMAFYYGNGYAKGSTYFDGETTTFHFYYYGENVNGIFILPPELRLSVSKFSGKAEFDSYFSLNELTDTDYFYEVEKNNEPYGFRQDQLSYRLNPLGNESIVPFTDRRYTYISYDRAAEQGTTMMLHGATGWNDMDVVAFKPVFCRLFDPTIDTNATYDFGLFRYVALDAAQSLSVSDYYFIIEVYHSGTLIPYQNAEIIYTSGNAAPTIVYAVGNIEVRVAPESFHVSPKKIGFQGVDENNIASYIQVEKFYDGRFEALPLAGNESSHPNGVEKYTALYDLLNDQLSTEDRAKLQIWIKPLFAENGVANKEASAGKKDIILDIGYVYLTEDISVSQNYEYGQTLVLSSVGEIKKLDIKISFDVTSALSKRATIENAVRKALGLPAGAAVSEEDYQKAYAVLSAFYPEEEIVSFEMAYGSALYDIKGNRDVVFGVYERDNENNIIYEQAYSYSRTQVGGANTDFFGNYFYAKNVLVDAQGLPIMVPKINEEYDYFVYGEDPYNHLVEPDGFDWNGVVDYSFLAVLSNDTMQISNYSYNRNTDNWSAVWLSEGQSNVTRVLSIDENTPPSGDNPGIMIKLSSGFESNNYTFSYLDSARASRAYITISKRNPVWAVEGIQTAHYVGKENTNFIHRLFTTEPRESDFSSNEAYLEALAYYRQYAELLRVSLDGHNESAQILGLGGLGLDIQVLQYGFPGEAYHSLSHYYGKDWSAYGVSGTGWILDMEQNATVKNAGTYVLRVALPETDTYKASDAVEVILTIERATIEVYLSPSNRDFDSDNPSVEYISDQKTGDALADASRWGWAVFSDSYRNYLSTINYKFFSQYKGQTVTLYETPHSIISQGMFEFDFCSVSYVDGWGNAIDATSSAGLYHIFPMGGASFNYEFDISRTGELSVLPIRKEIEVHFDGTGDDVIFTLNRPNAAGPEQIKIVQVEYDAGISNWIFVRRTEDNASDPRAIFSFNAKGEEAKAILSRPVGYLSIEEGDIYQYFRDHFGAKVGLDGNIQYTDDGYDQLGFSPIMAGEDFMDLTPSDLMKTASNSGYYIVELYAKSEDLHNYKEPYSVYVFLKINLSDMIVATHEEGMQMEYTGASFIVNQSGEGLGDLHSFYTNNQEISKYVKVYKGSNFIRLGGKVTALADAEVLREFDHEGKPLIMSSYEFSNTGIIDVGFYLVEITFVYLEGNAVKNYRLPDPPKAFIYVEIVKSEITLLFGNEEGLENWSYTGLPYELKERGTDSSEMAQGFTYETIPGLRIVRDDSGAVIDSYYEIFLSDIVWSVYRVNYKRAEPYTFSYDQQNEPIFNEGEGEELDGLPVNAGIYLMVMWADVGGSASSGNYSNSRPVAQYYVIEKAQIFLSVEGKEIPDGGGERYTVGKVYGEENPETILQVTYRGWVNGEHPSLVDTDKYPAGYTDAWINWNNIDRLTDAGSFRIEAVGDGCDNYEYLAGEVIFTILRAQATVNVNSEYATRTYTGSNHRTLPTFTPLEGAAETDNLYLQYRNGEINELPFAFYLNYNPSLTQMEISLVGKKNADGTVQTVAECIDAGTYVFSVSVLQSTNYLAFPLTSFEYEITRATLTATMQGAEMIYGEEYPTFDVMYSGFVGRDAVGLNEDNRPKYSISYNGDAVLKSGLNITTLGEILHTRLNIPANAIDYIESGYTIALHNGETMNYIINAENASATLMILRRELRVEKSSQIITKNYDGNIYTEISYLDSTGNEVRTNVIREEHYTFINLIHHHLKNERDVINLSFNATFDNENAGDKRIVTFNELYIDNSNYWLATSTFEADASIKKANPTINLLNTTYIYNGMSRAVATAVRGVRISATEYETVNYSIIYRGKTNHYDSNEPPENAGEYTVFVQTNDSNYEVTTTTANLTINKADVSIRINGDTAQVYGSVDGLTAEARGVRGFTRSVIVTYSLNSVDVSNIRTANAGIYTAKASFPGSTNYNAKTVEEKNFTIMPKAVSILFDVTPSFVYDGTMKKQVATFTDVNNFTAQTYMIYYEVTIDGLKPLNYENGQVNTLIAPKNAGNYIAVASPPNGNYVLEGELTGEFAILKRELTIGVADLTMNENEEATFRYINTGIAVGESERTLDKAPMMQYFNVSQQRYKKGLPEEPGVYEVLPYGAEDNNYVITYAKGKLTINKTQIVVNTDVPSGLVIDGSFSPDLELRVVVVQNSSFSPAKNSYDIFKQNNLAYENTTLGEVYEISVRNGEVTDNLVLRLKIEGAPKDLSEYRIALVKSSGEVVVIEADGIEGEYVLFSTAELGSFALLTEEIKAANNLWLYIAIGIAALLVLGAVLLIAKRA